MKLTTLQRSTENTGAQRGQTKLFAGRTFELAALREVIKKNLKMRPKMSGLKKIAIIDVKHSYN
ncbi:hypothetical protein IMPR6_140039 [Imperialibacter sp. EC-SDR9]|nr:hypothetical protein IMPERIA89_170133 [Imperialibacter sp. 89]CAD5261380.1 hypothetical protein IMPERIA75_260133 [Imperialibacter sp. 75]VVT03368.1 hypothetical protein IMPR6_140039 [Imperialibacter sp. EC-SDR9]